MSVADVLRSGDASAAREELLARGFRDLAEDPVVVDAHNGFVALQRRLDAADEWMGWLSDARRGLWGASGTSNSRSAERTAPTCAPPT